MQCQWGRTGNIKLHVADLKHNDENQGKYHTFPILLLVNLPSHKFSYEIWDSYKGAVHLPQHKASAGKPGEMSLSTKCSETHHTRTDS